MRYLLAALVLVSAAAAGAAEREFRGKRVPIHFPPHSQWIAGHPVHRLGTELRLGGVSFPVAEEKGEVLVGVVPGGEPLVRIGAGKPVRFAWTEAGAKREALLAFARDDGGTWTFWAAEAVRFSIDGEVLRLYDADADGRYGDLARDGWSAGDADQVLPLAKQIPLGPLLLGIRSIDPDGGRIVAETAPLPGTKPQVAALVRLNRLRTANGLPPALLDVGLSAACTAHASYLALHGWNGRSNPHGQDLGPAGASAEGLAAARRSVISPNRPETTIDDCWRTFYHRVGLMGAALDRIGVNEDPPDLAVVDVGRGFGEGDEAARAAGDEDVVQPKVPEWPWAEPVLVPADGSAGFPVAAGPELPKEPVPSLGSRGTPIMALFREGTEVAGFAGTLEEFRGTAAVALPVLVADPGDFPSARGLVPARPLRAGTLHRATFTWRSGGKECRRTVRFTTE